MIENFEGYFQPNIRFFLSTIKYNAIDTVVQENNIQVQCQETIKTDKNENVVQVLFERTIVLNPNVLFSMTVAFGAELVLKEEKAKDIDWDKVDLAEEFKQYGDFVVSGLASRTSLVIAEITSAAGFAPLILQPTHIK